MKAHTHGGNFSESRCVRAFFNLTYASGPVSLGPRPTPKGEAACSNLMRSFMSGEVYIVVTQNLFMF